MNVQSVSAKGGKKTAVAIAVCKKADAFEVTVNKRPLKLFQPQMLLAKVSELFSIIGENFYSNLSFDVSVRGGGDVTRMYAVRQAIAKSLLAYYGKFVDEQVKADLKSIIMKYDRYMVVTDSRRKEPKKAGGPSARTRYQKSYR